MLQALILAFRFSLVLIIVWPLVCAFLLYLLWRNAENGR